MYATAAESVFSVQFSFLRNSILRIPRRNRGALTHIIFIALLLLNVFDKDQQLPFRFHLDYRLLGRIGYAENM